MAGRKFGYIRVSSKDQNEARQKEKMFSQGLTEKEIFIEKQSGKNFERPKYQFLKQILEEGDTLYISSLDRFGRNKEQILQEWEDITKNIKANIHVIDMPMLNAVKDEYGVGELVNKLMLEILSWLAQEERNRIKTRQREGIDAAKKQGKHLGRPKLEIDQDFIDAYNKWKSGEQTAVATRKALGLKQTTFYRRVKEYEEQLAAHEEVAAGKAN